MKDSLLACSGSALTAGLCVLGIAFPARLAAQEADVRPPQQIADSLDIAALARSLTAGAASDSARAAALYEWIGRNISYDMPGYRSGVLDDGGPEKVYRRRQAVCGGFVGLFQRFAFEAGLATSPIIGYAKGFDHVEGAGTRKPNHAWLAVGIDGGWRLMDPTWAAGVVIAGVFQPRFTWDYFLVDPDEMVLSHFPEEGYWQLMPRPLRRAEFERLPPVPTTILRAGFDARTIRRLALASGIRDFPLVGERRGARIVTAPLSGTLPRASTVAVEIVWPNATDVALVSGGVWTKLARDGDSFSGQAPAGAETVSLVGRSGAGAPYETLLYYRVQ